MMTHGLRLGVPRPNRGDHAGAAKTKAGQAGLGHELNTCILGAFCPYIGRSGRRLCFRLDTPWLAILTYIHYWEAFVCRKSFKNEKKIVSLAKPLFRISSASYSRNPIIHSYIHTFIHSYIHTCVPA